MKRILSSRASNIKVVSDLYAKKNKAHNKRMIVELFLNPNILIEFSNPQDLKNDFKTYLTYDISMLDESDNENILDEFEIDDLLYDEVDLIDDVDICDE